MPCPAAPATQFRAGPTCTVSGSGPGAWRAEPDERPPRGRATRGGNARLDARSPLLDAHDGMGRAPRPRGDALPTGGTSPPRCQVADAGQDGGGVAGAGPVGVFAEGHVADPVDAVLDGPVPADQRVQSRVIRCRSAGGGAGSAGAGAKTVVSSAPGQVAGPAAGRTRWPPTMRVAGHGRGCVSRSFRRFFCKEPLIATPTRYSKCRKKRTKHTRCARGGHSTAINKANNFT